MNRADTLQTVEQRVDGYRATREDGMILIFPDEDGAAMCAFADPAEGEAMMEAGGPEEHPALAEVLEDCGFEIIGITGVGHE